MAVGIAMNKDVRAKFGDAIPNATNQVDIREVFNVNLSVEGGIAQVWLPTDITLTEEDVDSITACNNNVTCYESGVTEFPLTKAVKDSVVIPDCEGNNVSPQMKEQALQRYMFQWNALLIERGRRAVEDNAVEATVSGENVLVDIENMVQDLEAVTELASSNFVVKVSTSVFNAMKTPTTQTNVMAYTEQGLADYLGVSKVWKDSKASADIVIYPKAFAELGANCVTAPAIYSANGNPEYQGSSYVFGKMKYDGYALTRGAYEEFAKVTTYTPAVEGASATVKTSKSSK